MQSFTGTQWNLAEADPAKVEAIRQQLHISATAARCLAIRLTDLPSKDWLTPDIDQLHDPHLMQGMDAAVDRLHKAVRDRQRIRVVTDYDVDGTTSSLILQAALRLISTELGGAVVDYHIPDRFNEGYGFSTIAAQTAAKDGIHLIVTADIGVRDHAAVSTARERGLDVLICDHHLPSGAQVPADATVLCPPQNTCTYPNAALAACGISLKLADALLKHHPKRESVLASMLKLAAIGTVADLVPLTTIENRAIVALGLQELNRGPHSPGLQALLRVSGLGETPIRESDLGYRIGPRINAAGRVADAKLVVELLTSKTPAEAEPLAAAIDDLNSERKDIQQRLVKEALALSQDDPSPFLVLSGPEEAGWHRGVVGIVAARIRETVHRPVAIASIQGSRAVGSIRSTPSIHAVRALDSVSDLLEKYGGHPVAAGFTLPTENLPQFRERLGQYVLANSQSTGPSRTVDAELLASDVHQRLFEDLEKLSPFGQGNPRPSLVLLNVHAKQIDARPEKRLLKFRIPTAQGLMDAIWWDHAHLAAEIGSGPMDLLGELSEHHWNGTKRLQFTLSDARPAKA